MQGPVAEIHKSIQNPLALILRYVLCKHMPGLESFHKKKKNKPEVVHFSKILVDVSSVPFSMCRFYPDNGQSSISYCNFSHFAKTLKFFFLPDLFTSGGAVDYR